MSAFKMQFLFCILVGCISLIFTACCNTLELILSDSSIDCFYHDNLDILCSLLLPGYSINSISLDKASYKSSSVIICLAFYVI